MNSSDIAQRRVFVVDDDISVVSALARMMRCSGFAVEEFLSPQLFFERADLTRPGCVLLDLAMPGMTGLEVQERLSRERSLLSIVFLTGQANIAASVAAMRAGAIDFLEKPVEREALVAAVLRAFNRNDEARRGQNDREVFAQRFESLTGREKEIMRHLLTGRRNKQIAGDLGIVEKTVKVHRARVMAKMRVTSLLHLSKTAARAGFDLSSVSGIHKRPARAEAARCFVLCDSSRFLDQRPMADMRRTRLK